MRTPIRPLAVLSILFLVACKGEECKVEDIQYTKSLDAVGYGATEGVTLARFDLTQDFISHTPYAACAQGPLQDVGNVSLKITSLASKPFILRYDVQGLDETGIPVWSKPDTLGTIFQPGQTVDIGIIATSPKKLGEGGARLTLQTALFVGP